MLCREIMAVCSEIHTKHINTLCGQNVELLNVKLAVHIVTAGLQSVLLHKYTQIISRLNNILYIIINIMLIITTKQSAMLQTPTVSYYVTITNKDRNIQSISHYRC
jgi:hypothetical protein